MVNGLYFYAIYLRKALFLVCRKSVVCVRSFLGLHTHILWLVDGTKPVLVISLRCDEHEHVYPLTRRAWLSASITIRVSHNMVIKNDKIDSYRMMIGKKMWLLSASYGTATVVVGVGTLVGV